MMMYQVSSQVDAEDGDGSEGQRDVGQDEDEEGADLWDVTGQCVRDRLLQVVKDETTWRKQRLFYSLTATDFTYYCH